MIRHWAEYACDSSCLSKEQQTLTKNWYSSPTLPLRKKCRCFSAFCCSTVATSSKVCPKDSVNYYIQTEGVSEITEEESTCKCILKSHKSPSYPAKGWKGAATHEQHCRTLQLILSFRWDGASASSRGLQQRHQDQVTIMCSARRQRTKQNYVNEIKQLGEIWCKLTSSANTDESNERVLLCITGPGQNTSPRYNSHKPHSYVIMQYKWGQFAVSVSNKD